MEKSKKYNALLQRANLKPIVKHRTRKMVKSASDIELVIIYDLVEAELIKRGY